MTRGGKATSVSLWIVLLLLLICPGTTHAATLLDRWAARSAVSLPPMERVELHHAPCPHADDNDGCTDLPTADGRVKVYVRPLEPWSDRRILYHELGHAFDFLLLNNRERAKFMHLAALEPPWWRRPYEDQPGEDFAEAYRLCALGKSRRAYYREIEYGINGQYVLAVQRYGCDPGMVPAGELDVAVRLCRDCAAKTGAIVVDVKTAEGGEPVRGYSQPNTGPLSSEG
jgi:hypothetical protein